MTQKIRANTPGHLTIERSSAFDYSIELHFVNFAALLF